ncbi:MAG: hypothetical protein ABSH38_00405 [Verrucomicrobiota bacterium]|jgi:hypothetical protein
MDIRLCVALKAKPGKFGPEMKLVERLPHPISHSSHCLTNQASQTLDVRPHRRPMPSFAGDRLDVKTQISGGSSADPIHRQHRELPLKAAKNAGFNPENESKNPDKSG